jgi:hypothetical protein
VAPAVADDRDDGGDGCEDQESGEQDGGKFHCKKHLGRVMELDIGADDGAGCSGRIPG